MCIRRKTTDSGGMNSLKRHRVVLFRSGKPGGRPSSACGRLRRVQRAQCPGNLFGADAPCGIGTVPLKVPLRQPDQHGMLRRHCGQQNRASRVRPFGRAAGARRFGATTSAPAGRRSLARQPLAVPVPGLWARRCQTQRISRSGQCCPAAAIAAVRRGDGEIGQAGMQTLAPAPAGRAHPQQPAQRPTDPACGMAAKTINSPRRMDTAAQPAGVHHTRPARADSPAASAPTPYTPPRRGPGQLSTWA